MRPGWHADTCLEILTFISVFIYCDGLLGSTENQFKRRVPHCLEGKRSLSYLPIFVDKEIQKVMKILEYFYCIIGNTTEFWNIFVELLVTLLKSGHAVTQDQTVTCCECGSVVRCSARDLHHRLAIYSSAILLCLNKRKTSIFIFNWLPSVDRTVCHNEVSTSGMFKSSRTNVVGADN